MRFSGEDAQALDPTRISLDVGEHLQRMSMPLPMVGAFDGRFLDQPSQISTGSLARNSHGVKLL